MVVISLRNQQWFQKDSDAQEGTPERIEYEAKRLLAEQFTAMNRAEDVDKTPNRFRDHITSIECPPPFVGHPYVTGKKVHAKKRLPDGREEEVYLGTILDYKIGERQARVNIDQARG